MPLPPESATYTVPELPPTVTPRGSANPSVMLAMLCRAGPNTLRRLLSESDTYMRPEPSVSTPDGLSNGPGRYAMRLRDGSRTATRSLPESATNMWSEPLTATLRGRLNV